MMLDWTLLSLIIVLQLALVPLTLRLRNVSGERLAWAVCALAFLFMAGRRIILLARLATSTDPVPIDHVLEIVTLLVSLLVLLAMVRLYPVFLGQIKAHEEIRQSQERYRTLIEQASAGIFLTNPKGRLTDVNSTLCDMLGRTREELVGRFMRELIPRQESAADQLSTEEIRKGETVVSERELARSDGTSFPAEISARILSDLRIQGIVQDITNRKRQEAALRESQMLYHSLVETLPQSIHRKDAEGRYTFASGRFCAELGLPAERILGHTDSDLFPKELARRRLADDLRVIQTGATLELEEEHALPGRRRLFMQTSRTPVKDSRGRVVGVQGISWDVTRRKRADLALRASEARFRAAAEGALDSFVIMESVRGAGDQIVDFRFAYLNHVTQTLLGRSREETLGRLISEVIPGFHETGFFDKYVSVVETRETIEEVFRVRSDAIKAQWLMHQIVPLADGVAVTARDMSAERQAALSLREAEAKYRSIFENAVEGIFQISLEDKFITANPAMARIGGYDSVDDLLSIVEPVSSHFVREEDRSAIVDQFRRAGRVEGMHFAAYRKDRSIAWIRVSALAVRNEQGKIACFEGTVEDVTSRRLAEEQLRQSEARFRSYFELPLLGIAMTSPTKGWIEINDKLCDILGYSRDELLPLNWTKVTHPDDLAADLQRMQRLQSGEIDGDSYEKRYVHKSGRIVPALVSAKGVRNVDGSIEYLIVTVQDLTDRKKAEEERKALEGQIQHAQKLESLGVLAGGIAHDFNNLLMGVLGNASMALAETPDDGPIAERLRAIETSAQRAADLTSQLLAYAGKGRFVVRPLNLSQLVAEMAQLLEVSISKRITLRYDFADPLSAVEADAAQLRQVVMNLITNASDAIGDYPGTITLRTGQRRLTTSDLSRTLLDDELPEGEYVFVDVTDTGCGMDAETVQRVFDPFFTTKFAGRGLGLAAVLGIVRGHRGAIRVRSSPEKGTSFKVYFPASAKPAEAVDRQASPPPIRKRDGMILVIDDEEIVRDITKRMLEKVGFDVLTSPDGRSGIELFESRADEILLVLLDITMPGMSGEETFSELRRIRPDSRVLLSSGYNEADSINRFSGKGISGFIQKPYRSQDLVNKIQAIIETSPLELASGAPGGG